MTALVAAGGSDSGSGSVYTDCGLHFCVLDVGGEGLESFLKCSEEFQIFTFGPPDGVQNRVQIVPASSKCFFLGLQMASKIES